MSKLIFIDDDKDSLRQKTEWFAEGYTVRGFETAFEAVEHNADCYIFDVSAVCPFMLDTRSAYGPIATLAERHPGSSIIITSAMSCNSTEDIIENVAKACGTTPVYGGIGMFPELEAALKKVGL
jgi:hypothetical protein